VINLDISGNDVLKRTGSVIDQFLILGAGSSSGIRMRSNTCERVKTLAGVYGGHTTNAASNVALDNIGVPITPGYFGLAR